MNRLGRITRHLRTAASIPALALAMLVNAQTNPAPQALPYAQDFSALLHTSTAYPAGWQGWTISTTPGATFLTTGPTADRALIASSSASTNSGNVHNYNGKIGFLNSGSLDLTTGLALNTTGNANVQIVYDIMTLRNPYDGSANTRINEVTLQYRVGIAGAWTTLTGIEYQNNTTLQTGAGVTTPQNSQTKTVTLPIACDNQAIVQLRWAQRQVSGAGSRPSFALDNIVVTGSALGNTTVAFTAASSTVSEGVGTTNLSVAISNFSTTQATTVDVVITAGSAARVNNYTTQTVTFPANDGTNQNVTITVTDDAVYDGGGVVTFTLQNVAGGQGTPGIGAPSSHALTITENEPSPLLINEVDYDNEGVSDSLEFVELINTGLIAIDLSGYKVELVNGAGGAVYTSITLPSFSLAPGGYYVVGNDASIPNINLVTGANTNFIQNGSPDAVGLRDPGNNLLDAISYEGSTLAPYTEGTGLSVANSDDATPGIGISRFPNGSDSNNNSTDWGRHCLSPGAANLSTNANCICTPPEATAISQCIDDFTWDIVVSVTSTGSGSTVNITNDVNGSSQLAVGVGNWTIGPFNNNAVVNVTVAHQTFALCNLTLSGFFQNCQPDCNNVVGGPDVPGAPCDDLDAGTINDVWSPSCVCAGILIQPIVGFISPTSTVPESGVALTIGLEMDIAPTAPVVVDVTDLLTGTATSGADYGAIGTLQFTFLPSDTYPYLQTFNVIINDDPDYESTETFNLNLAVSSGTALTSTSTFVGVITSEDLPTLRINEVDYDNAGADNAEWIELKNTGNTAFSLSGFSVQLINGNLGGAAVYKTIVLPNFTLAAGGYYVIGNSNTIPNLNLLQTPATDMIQNGAPDAVGLRDPFNTLIDAISYEGNTGAPYTEGTGLSVAQADDNVLAAKVIARYLDGNDTDNNSVDWKVWCATPGASNSTVDADGDVIPDCLDNCPNLFGVQGDACNDNNVCTFNDVITNACVCAGTFQDTDGDGLCDANDNCPNLSGVQGDACNDNDVCTINDVITNACVCAGTFQDTDGDGLCDANDNCPTLSGVQGDACNDNDACTINDVITNACVCAGTFQDTDLDGVCDASDNCPTVPGQIGSVCNDSNPFTTGDVLNASCVCVGTPVPCDNWTLTIDAGTDGSAISWQIVDATSPFVLDNGGPYTNGSSNAETICVPQGACFNLTFTDDANGISGGGWKLVDNNGRRILDNVNNGGCFSGTSTNPLPFCNEPASAQTVIATQCDKENWIMSDVIIASVNAAVSAQYGIGDQTDDGYQFWFYNPCGGYSRRIFRNHATSGGQGPANALRATKLALSTMVTNPLPIGQLLNVRVRASVNGVYAAWGPACRFKVDPSACTVTQLNNFNTSPNYSCGVNGKVVGAGGNTGKVFANVVTSGGIYATHYRFEFSVAGEGYLRNVVSTTAVCVLGVWQTNPLLCGTYTYDVRVQASFDGGNTYCPFGPSCTVGITNNQLAPYCTPTGGSMMEQADVRTDEFDGGDFAMYPNPNDGSRLFLQMSGISEDVTTMSVDIFDAMGKRVSTSVMPVSGSAVNTVIELDNSMPNGLYFVTITSGINVRTERLVIQ